MRVVDYLSLAYEGLRERRGRSAGAVLGIVVAIVALSMALGIGVAFQQIFYEQFKRAFGPDIIFIIPKGGSLSEADISILQTLPNVQEVVPITSVPAVLKVGGESIGVSVYGVSERSLECILGVSNLKDVLEEGSGVLVGSDVIVGHYVAYKMSWSEGSTTSSVKRIEVGQQIILVTRRGKNTVAIVSGILKPTYGPTAGFVNVNTGVFMDINVFFQYFKVTRTYNYALVKVKDVNRIGETTDLIKTYLPNAQVLNLGFILEQFKTFTNAIQVFLGAVSGIGLFITGLWIFDTMTINVIQRTREIGILKTLGFKRRQIMLLFISESLVMTIIGIAIGLALALIASRFVGIPMFNLTLRPAITPEVVAITGLTPLVTNILATLIPAYRAARLDPVEALRYE